MTPTLSPTGRACALAYAHIGDKTLADATPAEIRACIRHPAVREVQQRLDVVVETEDVVGTQQVLQALNRTYKAALQEIRREEAA